MQTLLQRQRSVQSRVRRYRLRCIAQLLKHGASESLCDRVLYIWENGSAGKDTPDDKVLNDAHKILARATRVPNHQRIAA